jgi:hypothetical protein
LEQFGGTVSFNGLFGSALLNTSPGSKALELDLAWSGLIECTIASTFLFNNLPNPPAGFSGYFNGSFTNAYIEISGQFSGYFTSLNSISLHGKAQGVTLGGGFINASLKDVIDFSGTIENGTLVGNIVEMSFSQVYITQLFNQQSLGGYISGNVPEAGDIKLNSVIVSRL